MIEITLTEMFLLVWAVLATAGYLSAKQDEKVARHILRIFIENPEARKQMVNAFEDLKKKANI